MKNIGSFLKFKVQECFIRNIECSYLDGVTKESKRLELVEERIIDLQESK